MEVEEKVRVESGGGELACYNGVLFLGGTARLGGGHVSESGGTSAADGDGGTVAMGREQAKRGTEIQEARARLEGERRRIQEEISRYPAPIAGCDEQFNYLLERRSQVRRELARLVEEESLGGR